MPVYMEYWTATADQDGTTGFHPDRYGRDPILQARLAAIAHHHHEKGLQTQDLQLFSLFCFF